MKRIVQKFGGTSLENIERIKNAVRLILHYVEKGYQVTVVVSAMGDYTDRLMELAGPLDPEKAPREMDMLLSTGERVSAALMALALEQEGQKAISFTGSQCGIITDGYHGHARIQEIRPHRILESLEQGYVVVVAGFQGISTDRDITTLGRGGSDLTAVALAIALEAESCQIYTDVQGIYDDDPRKDPQAELCLHLSHRQGSALASGGACILHDRAALLAEQAQMPLEIRASFAHPSDPYSYIGGGQQTLETPRLTALSQRNDLALIQAPSSSPDGILWLIKHDHYAYKFWKQKGLHFWCFSKHLAEIFQKEVLQGQGSIEEVSQLVIVGYGLYGHSLLMEILHDALMIQGDDQSLWVMDEERSLAQKVQKIKALLRSEKTKNKLCAAKAHRYPHRLVHSLQESSKE